MSGYDSNADLPRTLRRSLNEEQQDIYRLAYNNAIATGKHHDKAVKAGRMALRVSEEGLPAEAIELGVQGLIVD